jgi:hypothetical protein
VRLEVGEHLRDFLGAREPAGKKFLRNLLERELVSPSACFSGAITPSRF